MQSWGRLEIVFRHREPACGEGNGAGGTFGLPMGCVKPTDRPHVGALARRALKFTRRATPAPVVLHF